MAERLDDKELVSFKEMLMANSVQVDALCQLLIEKGIITEEEFVARYKKVDREMKERRGSFTKKLKFDKIREGFRREYL